MPEYGKGVEYSPGISKYVKETAFKGKLFGIVNGNSNNWDPRTNKALKNWTNKNGQTFDLSVSPDMDPNIVAQKLKTAQRELCNYLKSFDPNDPRFANLDPEKPIVFYVGRYDSQKGIDKLLQIMWQALESGAQFVCVGTGADKNTKPILADMKK